MQDNAKDENPMWLYAIIAEIQQLKQKSQNLGHDLELWPCPNFKEFPKTLLKVKTPCDYVL